MLMKKEKYFNSFCDFTVGAEGRTPASRGLSHDLQINIIFPMFTLCHHSWKEGITFDTRKAFSEMRAL